MEKVHMSTVMPSAARPAGAAATPARGGWGEFFKYHGVWAPGIRLFRRIGFRAKATLISTIFLLPMALLAWVYYGDKAADIGFSAAERVGVQYVRDALPVLRAAQHERTLAMISAAQGQAVPDLAAAAQATKEVLARLATTDGAIGGQLGTQALHQRLVDLSAALPAPSAGLEKILEAHDQRVTMVLQLITQAADGSNLTLDPDLDTYYLMEAVTSSLPALVETAVQLQAAGRAMGAAAAPRRRW
jgi:hypothetical protein